ncbi:MAG: GRRM system radical SAM/SPASM domain protein [Cyanobacteria bacterium]|nr:GRRM system radical SAM/SPASM domain protein [Cyanobacteria bacterium CG_2015-16_32_12]NCO79116.1 GRRM system radical SAM/SPASM domain protein [Cyanobacteria bacterium CG_2015-22_32_23]NCQ03693.1 GRRM system radical SAM/SPASM domain protein [Cyanobacteria bacterium CG_2015-09_32_10]NCQ40463.1 GRRM system radical SAM/SPASM domain protein [Cyanobacteria bacterium CG_2015-04_32_10]NCS84940.1 GRRM system radical SAM/SPASM domain protein [Cyanobacteria bacterium CG_2015-02_32_10]
MAKAEKKTSETLKDTSKFGPISLVIIQPTSFCNLDCDYCYLPDRYLQNRLSLDLIDPIFKSIFTSPFFEDNFTVCWHAGEPLTMPISFYKSAFQLINEADKKYNKTNFGFNYSYQTNGTLINQGWCDFWQEYPVHVGVSIDGPAFLHDSHRKNRKGGNSHDLTMRGIRYLQKNNIPYNTISVITEESLNYPDEMFNFFLENEIYDIAFNMEETEGVNELTSLNGKEIELRYIKFIERFWQLVTESKLPFIVREFEVLISLIYSGNRLKNTDMNKPFVIVNYDYLGNFSTFDPELLSVKTEKYGDFIFGNVLTDTLEYICDSNKFKAIYHDINEGVKLCADSCSYFGICGGGAGSNKYWENGTFASTETQACRYRIKILTDVLVTAMEKSLKIIS